MCTHTGAADHQPAPTHPRTKPGIHLFTTQGAASAAAYHTAAPPPMSTPHPPAAPSPPAPPPAPLPSRIPSKAPTHTHLPRPPPHLHLRRHRHRHPSHLHPPLHLRRTPHPLSAVREALTGTRFGTGVEVAMCVCKSECTVFARERVGSAVTCRQRPILVRLLETCLRHAMFALLASCCRRLCIRALVFTRPNTFYSHMNRQRPRQLATLSPSHPLPKTHPLPQYRCVVIFPKP